MNAPILMVSHVGFGLLGTLCALVIFVDLQNLNPKNIHRIKYMSWGVVAGIVLSYVTGGYWYVVHYGADEALIKAGAWPWAHNLVMEVKEHTFFMVLILSALLPLLLKNLQSAETFKYLNSAKVASAMIFIMGLMMEATGAIIALGVRMGM